MEPKTAASRACSGLLLAHNATLLHYRATMQIDTQHRPPTLARPPANSPLTCGAPRRLAWALALTAALWSALFWAIRE
jgi:hypothetical protein